MRVGQNPAKSIPEVTTPARITVAIITYIPFLGGYYSDSLEVLKTCLGSLWENTDLPYDLLVFDNASCPPVREFLSSAHRQGKIQFLFLSDKNIGKGGAWNIIFAGAPGEIIAYADSDIYFFPGWLSTLVKVVETFPNLGMVTGLPMWSPPEFSTSTVEWAGKQPGVHLERGRFLAWEDYWRHARSLGQDELTARSYHSQHEDLRLTYQGQRYFVGAGHFQFVAPRKALLSALPIPSERPMGQVRSLDIALNANGYLRLSTPEWWVQHIGNTLQGLELTPAPESKMKANIAPSGKSRVRLWKPLRRFLIWIHDKSFEILFRS